MATVLFAMTTIVLHAQNNNYGAPIFSDNLRGGHTMFGNTILQGGNVNGQPVMNMWQTPNVDNGYQTSNYVNDTRNMQYIDIDTDIPADPGPELTLIAKGSAMNYYVRNTSTWSGDYFNYTTNNGPSDFRTSTSTNGFASGSMPIGYSLGTLGTTIPSATNSRNRRTYYFKKVVNISSQNLSRYTSMAINVDYDDGVIVYVNNREVGRANMPNGTINYNSWASSCNTASTFRSASFDVPTDYLNTGNNIIAVEVHQSNNCNQSPNDIYLDLEMKGTTNFIPVPGSVTFNSSSADLVFPSVAGAFNIKFARLYWGGRVSNTVSDATLKTVKIKKGSGAYATINDATVNIEKQSLGNGFSAYQCYRDITSFVQSHKAGTYTVADISTSLGASNSGGNFGGWTIVVVYENANLNYSSVRVYHGFELVEDNNTKGIKLENLSAPSNPTSSSDIYMSVMAWEGDAGIGATTAKPDGDFIKVNDNFIGNTVNPRQNFWNGTISKNGAHVTTKFPHYLNQMGIDIDEIELGAVDGQGQSIYGIGPSSSTIEIEFGTETDQYFPSVFAFTMFAKDPTVSINKGATITGGGPANMLAPAQTITYTLNGKNEGNGNALQTVIVDTIPAALTYIPGSLVINNAPNPSGAGTLLNVDQSDAPGDDYAEVFTANGKTVVKFYIGTGATSSTGGVLAPGRTYSVSLKCLTPDNAHPGYSVTNTANVRGVGIDGETFIDVSSHMFGPGGAALPVKLTGFKVVRENDVASLSWTTHGELNSDRFEIERSFDGVAFTKVGTVRSNGNTEEEKSYSFRDAISNNTNVIYYRLRMVDIDATSSYSKIVALRLNGLTTLSNFTVYPNPFTSNVKMQLNSVKASKVTVRINNAAGIQQISKVFDLQQGENIIVVQDLENLKPGVHLVEIITEDGKMTQKIMKK